MRTVAQQPTEHKKGNGWKLIAENLTKEQCQEALKGAVFDNGSDKTVLKVRYLVFILFSGLRLICV